MSREKLKSINFHEGGQDERICNLIIDFLHNVEYKGAIKDYIATWAARADFQ